MGVSVLALGLGSAARPRSVMATSTDDEVAGNTDILLGTTELACRRLSTLSDSSVDVIIPAFRFFDPVWETFCIYASYAVTSFFEDVPDGDLREIPQLKHDAGCRRL
jgi:hypothetical protein